MRRRIKLEIRWKVKLKIAFGDVITDQPWGYTRDVSKDHIGVQIKDQIKDQTDYYNQIRNQIRDSLRDQVEDWIQDALGDQIRN